MATEKQQNNHRPPTDGGMAKEEFIRVGTTLYKIVELPKLNGGYVRKRIPWNNETLRQDYGRDYIGSVFPSMTASAPYPNMWIISPWSASSLTSTSR